MIEALENIIERVKGYEREARLEADDHHDFLTRAEFEEEKERLLSPVVEGLGKMEQTLGEFWEKFDEKFPAI